MKTYKEHRFEENPLEKQFVDEFKKGIIDRGLISRIVFADNTRELTEVEKRIVLSTIQWLGSPVGQSFLNRVNPLTK